MSIHSPEIFIKIEKNLCKQAEDLISSLRFKLSECIIVSDRKIFNKYRQKFEKKFLDKVDKTLILNQPHANDKHIKKIINHAQNAKLIIAIGSGTINDLCKYSAKLLGIKYLVFATAPSMNGYASINASITINSHKKTLLATLPIAIFADLELLKSSPKKMIKAGIADAMCLYSSWFDWRLSNLIFKTNFNQKCFEIQQDMIDYLFKNYHRFEINNQEFLMILLKLLILSGNAMTIANGSYPASQSEHLIAHCLELKYPNIKKILHGQLIAITFATSLEIQKKLLTKLVNNKLLLTKVDNNWQKIIERFFINKISLQCIEEYRLKIKTFNQSPKTNKYLAENYQNIYHQLNEIYKNNQTVIKIFKHFKINQNIKILGINQQKYDQVIERSKYIRNRITCLDFL